MSSAASETIDRILNHKGVGGVIVVSPEGIPAYSSMDNATTLQYISMSQTLVGLSRGLVRDVDPQNDLVILRIRTRKSEIIVAPEKSSKDKDSYLIVIQNEEK